MKHLLWVVEVWVISHAQIGMHAAFQLHDHPQICGKKTGPELANRGGVSFKGKMSSQEKRSPGLDADDCSKARTVDAH
jgi:hypothetical protein